jgi:hypothetical protein
MFQSTLIYIYTNDVAGFHHRDELRLTPWMSQEWGIDNPTPARQERKTGDQIQQDIADL